MTFTDLLFSSCPQFHAVSSAVEGWWYVDTIIFNQLQTPNIPLGAGQLPHFSYNAIVEASCTRSTQTIMIYLGFPIVLIHVSDTVT